MFGPIESIMLELIIRQLVASFRSKIEFVSGEFVILLFSICLHYLIDLNLTFLLLKIVEMKEKIESIPKKMWRLEGARESDLLEYAYQSPSPTAAPNNGTYHLPQHPLNVIYKSRIKIHCVCVGNEEKEKTMGLRDSRSK